MKGTTMQILFEINKDNDGKWDIETLNINVEMLENESDADRLAFALFVKVVAGGLEYGFTKEIFAEIEAGDTYLMTDLHKQVLLMYDVVNELGAPVSFADFTEVLKGSNYIH